MKFKLLQGKRKIYIWGEFNTYHETMDYLIKKQREGKRGLYIVKVEPYNNKYNQLTKISL